MEAIVCITFYMGNIIFAAFDHSTTTIMSPMVKLNTNYGIHELFLKLTRQSMILIYNLIP